ncbi:MAG: bis(5'-nucleosyl)-tetraphosphatase [Nitrososphaerota archaeon]|nr:bis(5'-nucleosyl)-tetraphosphatase [Candidatus Calditenuis fumarioli]
MVRRERSAGFVVFSEREDGTRLYLLLHYPSGHWDFPKGHVEQGESDIRAALRELREETGLNDVEVLFGFRKEISYFYTEKGEKVHKSVVYYLGKSKTTDVRISHEHKGFEWLPFEEAMSRLRFRTSREVLAAAEEFLRGQRT